MCKQNKAITPEIAIGIKSVVFTLGKKEKLNMQSGISPLACLVGEEEKSKLGELVKVPFQLGMAERQEARNVAFEQEDSRNDKRSKPSIGLGKSHNCRSVEWNHL